MANILTVSQFLVGAQTAVDAFFDQNWLERREAEDDSRGEPAGQYRNDDLS